MRARHEPHMPWCHPLLLVSLPTFHAPPAFSVRFIAEPHTRLLGVGVTFGSDRTRGFRMRLAGLHASTRPSASAVRRLAALRRLLSGAFSGTFLLNFSTRHVVCLCVV